MTEWLKEYWYLLIILVAVCILTAVIFYFAVRAYRKRTAIYKKEEEKIKRLVALKEHFRPMTEEAIMSCDSADLLEGVALYYQLKLQNEENQEEKFELLNDDVKDIYTLDVFVQDKTSKEFFSQNGDILRKRILPALVKIGMSDFSEKLRVVYDMYDNSNENVSYSVGKIDEIDSFISENDILSNIKLKSAEFICINFKSFIN